MQNRIVYITALLLSILILFILSFSVYNLPSADDFVYGIINNSLTIFQRSLNDYMYGGSGRIFSNFLYYCMAGYGNSHLYFYKIIPVISMMLWIFVFYLIFCELFKNYSKKIILSLLIVFQAVWMFSLASVNDTIFWLGGITNYFIPLSLFFLILLFIYKAYNSKDIIKYSLLLLTANLILFIISFSNESLFFTFYILYLLIFIYGLVYKQSKLVQSIIPSVIVLTIVLFITAVSPGSANRMGGGKWRYTIWYIQRFHNFA